MEDKDIVWGEAVATPDGQPEWLDDDVLCRPRWGDSEEGRYDEGGALAHCVASWGLVKDILLPADHPHYASAPSIDWTKPLELMDGTALVLAEGIQQPDGDGEYWLAREDGEHFTISQRGYPSGLLCVGPVDGDTLVRNRAATNPTEPYGPPIEVAGVRPAWLGDDVGCMAHGFTGWYGSALPSMEWGWSPISRIRLPRDHFAYTAIAKGFEPWGGGDKAPGDWDGGEVLRRGGAINEPVWGVDSAWAHDAYPSSDIIGYRKAVNRDHMHISDADFSRSAEILRDHIDALGGVESVFDEDAPNTVTITRMTEAEWMDVLPRHNVPLALHIMGLILPEPAEPTEPTPIEAFETENPGIVTDENRHWFELALGWGR